MEFDPFSTEFFENPYEVYRWLRDEAPAYHNDELGFWAVSRYDDCAEVHRDVAAYTSTHGLTLDQLRSSDFAGVVEGSNMMILMDPPMHERMRKLVSRAFTPRRIAEWEPVVKAVIADVLDDLAGSRSFDAVVDFAGPFPVEVICSIVGVPKPDRQQIRHWTDASLERDVGSPFPTRAGIEASIAAREYLLALVADKRRQPSDDMIGHLIEAEVEREDGEIDHLSDQEIANFISLLTAAGSETVTKLVGNAVMTFAENPDELDQLIADPSLAPAAVEEVLRYKAPSQYQGRYSLRDRDWHGVTIPAGNPVLIVTGAANRDPRAYDDPDRFDIDREAPLGISFGHGIHYCIGAHLARLEGRVAFTELYRRWPHLEVDLDGVAWVHMSNVAGPARVLVTTGGTS
jgi:cytochrome P450